jgi:hypothetical protein
MESDAVSRAVAGNPGARRRPLFLLDVDGPPKLCAAALPHPPPGCVARDGFRFPAASGEGG